MANFNTYQTRHFYVAGAIDTSLDTVGDIAIGTTGDKEQLFFKYVNEVDGKAQVTRTDLIKVANITSLKKTAASEMDTPLPVTTIALDGDVASNLSNYVGKIFALTINLRQLSSYDSNDSLPITVTLVGTSTNTASASAFYNALAGEIAKNKPAWAKQSFKAYLVKSGTATEATANNSVSGATGIVLVPEPCAYRRGVLSKDIFEITVSSRLHGDEIAWATEMLNASSKPYKTIADVNTGLLVSISPTVIPSVYKIADLEWFAYGERGDDKRGYLYPHNYETKYHIDLTKEYDILTIEYFWAGGAENVQKSPRLIQIAAEHAQNDGVVDTLYDSVAALMAGVSAS